MTDPVARLDAALTGRYRIERELGRGGMAVVYLAEDLKHGRRTSDARRIFDSLEATNPSPFQAYGLIHLAADLGEKEKALRWVAYEPPHAFFPWIAVERTLAPLRADPGFTTVFRRLKLPM